MFVLKLPGIVLEYPRLVLLPPLWSCFGSGWDACGLRSSHINEWPRGMELGPTFSQLQKHQNQHPPLKDIMQGVRRYCGVIFSSSVRWN